MLPPKPALHAPVGFGVPTEIVSDLADLAAAWDQLAVGSGSPMHHYAWVSACAETLSPPTRLEAVIAGTRERPIAIAPLIKRRSGLPRLELLGVRRLHEPMDLIYRNSAGVAALAEALTQLGLPVFLERVPAESFTVAVV